MLFLPKVKAMRDEFGELHIRDERLDEILNRDDEHIKARQVYPQLPPGSGYISIFDIQETGDRLTVLASQIPQ